MPLLRIENTSKHIGGVAVNQNISLTIQKGSIVGLIGPNGAGKSTLFKTINGFIRPDEGEIYFEGHPIVKKKTFQISRMGIACTFQHAQLFPHITLGESVLLGAYCHEHKKSRAQNIAREKIEFVGLLHKEHTLVGMLNMFERKKAELAAALATLPKLLLLDELFAGLVPTEVELMLQLIKRVHKEYDVTLFIVEHVAQVITQLCHKIYVLEYGQLIASGTVQEIVCNPRVIMAYLGVDNDDFKD